MDNDHNSSSGHGSKVGSGSRSNASGSVNSSAVSSRIQQRQFLPKIQLVFPVLMQLEVHLNWKISAIGLLIETLQLIGLVFNPQFTWGATLGNIITKIIYAFNLPFYDSSWASGTFIPANIFFWFYISALLVTIIVIIIVTSSNMQTLGFISRLFCRGVMHSFASVGVIPITLLCTSFMTCDSATSTMFWYTKTDCSSAFNVIYFAFGVVGLLMLLIVSYVTSEFLYDDLPDSTMLLARPSSGVTTLTLLYKFGSSILFSVLASKGSPYAFAPTFCVLSFLHAVQHIMIFPYYIRTLNQFRVCQLFIVSFVAAVASANVSADNIWHKKELSTVVALVGGAIAGLIGWYVAKLRVNRAYLRNLEGVQYRKLTGEIPAIYPSRLPEHEYIYASYPNIEQVILGDNPARDSILAQLREELRQKQEMEGVLHQGNEENTEEHDDEHEIEMNRGGGDNGESDDMTILDSYISSILMKSDVELSTRFLREFIEFSGAPDPTPRMLVFAGRIFMKGLVKYGNDPLINYCFCIYLVVYAKRLRIALNEITNLIGQPTTIPLGYRIYRLAEQLKKNLNMSYGAQMKAISTSMELHKEILTAMSSFWSKLASGNATSEQLSHVADYITRRREYCKNFYNRILLNPNQAILLNYAKFLRDVMLDEDSAQKLHKRVTDEADLKRQEILNTGGGGGGVESTNWDGCVQFIKALDKREHHSDTNGEFESANADPSTNSGKSKRGGHEIQRLRLIVFIVFGFIIIITLGLMVYVGVRSQMAKKMADRILASSRRGRLVSSSVLWSNNLLALFLSTPNPPASNVTYYQNQLSTLALSIQELHNSLSYGKYFTKYPAVVNYMNDNRIEIVQPGTMSVEGNLTRMTTNLVNLGSQIASTLVLISQAPITSPPIEHLRFIVANGYGTFSGAFNGSVQTYIDERNDFLQNTQWILIVFYLIAVFLLITSFAFIRLYLCRIEYAKLSILNLFSLIPKSYIDLLFNASKERLQNYDKDDNDVAQAEEDPMRMQENNFQAGHVNFNHPSSMKKRIRMVDIQEPKDAANKKENAEKAIEGNNPQAGTLDASPLLIENSLDAGRFDVDRVSDDEYEAEDPSLAKATSLQYWFKRIFGSCVNSKFLLMIVIITAIISIGAFAADYKLYATLGEARKSAQKSTKFHKSSTSLYRYVDDLRDTVQDYVLNGKISSVQRYYDTISSTNFLDVYQAIMNTEQNIDAIASLVNARSIIESALLRQQMSLWLSSMYYNVSGGDQLLFSLVNAIRRSYNFPPRNTILERLASPFSPQTPTTTIATTDTVDVNLPYPKKYEAAKNLIFDDFYESHDILISRYFSQVRQYHHDSHENLLHKSLQWWVAAVILNATAMLLIIFVIRAYFSAGWISFQFWGFTICGLLLVANIVLLSLSLSYINSSKTAYDNYVNVIYANNGTLSVMSSTRSLALRTVIYGYTTAQNLWANAVDHTALSESMAALLTGYLYALPEAQRPEAAVEIVNMYDCFQYLKYFSEIAVLLAEEAYSLPPTPSLQEFTYNRRLESGFELEYFLFGNSTGYYSNKVDDSAKPKEEKCTIAEGTLSGARYEFVSRKYRHGISETLKRIENYVRDKVIDTADRLRIITLAIMTIGIALLVIFVLTLIYSVFKILMKESGGNNRNDGVDFSEIRGKTSSSIVTASIFFSIFFIVVGFTAIFALAIYSNQQMIGSSPMLGLLIGRDWLLTDTFVNIQRIWFASPDPTLMTPYGLPVLATLSKAIEARSELYFQTASGMKGVIGQSPATNKDLFGSKSYNWYEFRYSCIPNMSLGFSVNQLVRAKGITPEQEKLLFEDGVEGVLWQLTGLTFTLINVRQARMAMLYLQPYSLVTNASLSYLQSATDGFLDAMNSRDQISENLTLGLTAFLFILILLFLFLVFKPILNHLTDAEEGTKLLLRMIPEKVRRDVPSFSEFLKTGNVNEGVEMISRACRDVQSAMIVAIRYDDVIVFLSREVMRRFHYSEGSLLNHKVNILFSDERAKLIDAHRSRTGNSRFSLFVGQSVRSCGRRSDGVTFPIEMSVRDVRRNNDSDSIYVLRFRNVTVEADINLLRKTQGKLLEVSRQPQFIATTDGVIQVANKMACTTFGYTRDELANQCLTSVMPSFFKESAPTPDNHSHRSRPENKLGSTFRHLVGVSKLGEEIPFEANTSEVRNAKGKSVFIMTTLRNISQDIVSIQSELASNALISLSPVPIVMFNSIGVVTVFSPAAEASWGYKATEVIGSNLKMLMEGDSKHYDFSYSAKSDLKYFIEQTRPLEAKRKNGEIFFVETTMKELRRGDQISFIAYFKDLSEELRITQRNAMSHTSFDTSPSPIVVMDDYGIVKAFNAAAEKQFGYRSNQVIGENIKILMPDHIARSHDLYLERYRQSGIKKVLGTQRREYAKRADGRLIPIELNAKEILVDDLLSEEGRRVLFVGYLRDISEEYQMRKANEINDAITKHCPVPTVSIDCRGTILSFNPAAEDQFECRADDVIGQNIKLLMPSRYSDYHDEYLANYLANGTRKVIESTREVEALRSNGKEFPVEIRVREIRKGVVDPIFVGSIRDITSTYELYDAKSIEDAFINLFPQSIVAINPQGIIKYFSQEAVRAFGWEAKTIIGKNVKVLMPLQDAKNHDAYLQRFAENGSPETLKRQRHVQAVRKDGLKFACRLIVKELKVEVSCSTPRRGKDGFTSPTNSDKQESFVDTLYVGFLWDLTGEDVLKQSSAIKDAVLTKFQFSTIQVNSEGAIQYANPAFIQEFGFANDQAVIGKNVNTLVPQKSIENSESFFEQLCAMSNEVNSTREYAAQRCDGTIFHMQVGAKKVSDEATTTVPGTYFVFIRNVNHLVRTRSQRVLARSIINTSPVPLFVCSIIKTMQAAPLLSFPEEGDEDPMSGNGIRDGPSFREDAVIFDLNEAAETLIGYEKGELVGKSLSLIQELSHESPTPVIDLYSAAPTPPLDDTQSKSMIDALTLKKGPSNKVVVAIIKVKRKNGTCVPVRLCLFEIYNEEYSQSVLAVYAEEISVRLQRQLEERVSSSIFNIAPRAIVCCDNTGAIVLFNKQAEQMFGYRIVDVLGKESSVLLQPDASKPGQNLFSRLVDRAMDETVDTSTSNRQIARHSSGKTFPIECKIFTASSSPPGAVDIVDSLSAQRYSVAIIKDLSKDASDAITSKMSDQIIKSIPTPLVVINTSSVIEEISDSLCHLLGYVREELIGRNIKLLMAPEVAKHHNNYISHYLNDRLRRTNKVKKGFIRVAARHKQGYDIPVEIAIGSCDSHELGICSIFAYLRDIRHEVDVAQEQQLNDALTRLENIAILVVSENGEIKRVSNTTAELFGYDNQELLLKQPISIIMPKIKNFKRFLSDVPDVDPHSAIRKSLQKDKETSEFNVMERRVDGLRRNGSNISCTVHIKEMIEGNGEVSYTCFVSDFSHYQRESDLFLLTDVINNMNLVAIVETNVDGVITLVNQKTCDIFGYSSPNELIGQNVTIFMSTRDAKEHSRFMKNYVAGTSSNLVVGKTRRLVGIKKDKTEVHLDQSVEEYISDTLGRKFVAYMIDLTDSIKIEIAQNAVQAILSFMPAASFLVSGSEGVIMQVSNSTTETFQERKENIVGKRLQDLLLDNPNLHIEPGEQEIVIRPFGKFANPRKMTLITTKMETEEKIWELFLCIMVQKNS